MGEIYSKCQRVLIWLGQEIHDPNYMSYYLGPTPPLEIQQKTKHTPLSASRLEQPGPQSFVRNLLALPWFTRAWVVQEAVLPTLASCFLGAFTFSIEDLWAVIVHFRSAERYLTQKDYVNLRQLPGYIVLNEIMRLRMQARYQRGPSPNEATCFYHSLSIFAPRSQTSSRHDIIFAFLGLQRDQRVKIVPDYDMDWDVVPCIATKAIIEATGSLNLFGLLHRKDEDASRWPILPSWVPDWSRTPEAEPLVFPRSWIYFDASARRRHKARAVKDLATSHLVVAGKIIGEVANTLAFTKGLAEPLANRHGWDVCSYLNLVNLNKLLGQMWLGKTTAPSMQRLLEVILADGSFTLNQKLREHCSEGLPASDVDELASTYLAIQEASKERDVAAMSRSKKVDDFGKRATRFRDHARVAWGRQIIVGRDWRLGLAHRSVCEGDLICVVHGSQVPFILRRQTSGYYRLMGQCYFESAMRGEEVTWDEADADEFILA
ncbi:hypothetical protein J4E91_009728 [Alternaria rosae]|nr:hypothetical protein J4E91_009728 [Alternaria rosae]